MSVTDSTLIPFPDLPVDVVRVILETTAILDRHSSLALVLLSKTVRLWIDPILYRVVRMRGEATFNSFCVAIESRANSPDPHFLARTVRVLSLFLRPAVGSRDQAERIIDSCSGARICQLYFWEQPPLAVPQTVTHLCLLDIFSVPNAAASVPPSVTHLCLACPDLPSRHWDAVIPALTHLMITYLTDLAMLDVDGLARFVADVFALSPRSRLRAVIFQPIGEYQASDARLIRRLLSAITDARFVFVSPEPARAHIEGIACFGRRHDLDWDWGYLPSTRVDSWEVADSYLDERSRQARGGGGEIQAAPSPGSEDGLS